MTWKKPRMRSRSNIPTFETWHGTHQEFEEFDVFKCDFGIHSGTGYQAEEIAGEDGRMIPLYVTLKNPIRLVDRSGWYGMDIWKQVVKAGYVMDPGNRFLKKIEDTYPPERSALVRKKLMNAGYDGIVYLNRHGGISHASFRKIRDAEDASDFHTTDDEILQIAPEARDSYIAFCPSQVKKRDK